MVLVQTGNGEKIVTAGTNSTLYKLNSLNLRFIFYAYRFENRCLGDVYLYGEITCEVIGDYTEKNGSFKGKARCINGPTAKPETLIYIAETGNHHIALNANLEIHGNPYNLRSYDFSGAIEIDDKPYDLAEIVSDAPSCSSTL